MRRIPGALISLVLALSLFGGTAHGATRTRAAGPASFYLALGASVSLGVEPAGGTMVRTDHGYANVVAAATGANLYQLGCPGESARQLITGHDPCNRSGPSQLSAATAFLEAHRNESGLVTIDIGFNDVAQCLHDGAVDQTCLNHALETTMVDLSAAVGALESSAGPRVTIIGLNHYDPYAALRTSQPLFAAQASAAVGRLNSTLSSVYGAMGVPVANVARVFASGSLNDLSVRLDGQTAARMACALTWMCTSGQPANIHPTNLGYSLIAQTILASMGWPVARTLGT